jgi:hypothetical protein
MSDTKSEWLARVLGVTVGRGAGAGRNAATIRRDLEAAQAAWLEATATVDQQLNALRALLLRTKDPDLHRIAEYGLNGITGTRKVALAKALQEVTTAPDGKLVPLAGKAAQAAAEFRAFVQADRRVAACDSCREVTVTIGATLGGALGRLERALAA